MSDAKPNADESREANRLRKSVKTTLARAKRFFAAKWPGWVNWLFASVVVPTISVLIYFVHHQSSTIDDIKNEQKANAAQHSLDLQHSIADIERTFRSDFTKSRLDAQADAASRQKAFELLAAELKSAQELRQVKIEKDLQTLLARQKESILQEQRQRIDGLQLFADSYELAGKLADANDARRYRDTITLFQAYTKKTPANDMPQAMRKFIFSEAARAFSIHGAYGSITDAEFEEMQKSLREEAPGSLTHLHIATIHVGKGQFEKARLRCKQGIDALIEIEHLTSSRYICSPFSMSDLTEYYGLPLLIDLATSKHNTDDAKLSSCWSVLDLCEERAFAHPGTISERLGRSSLLALAKYLSIASSGLDRPLKTMISQLKEYTYVEDVPEKPDPKVKYPLKRINIVDIPQFPVPMPKTKKE